jgi:hypothetical protein
MLHELTSLFLAGQYKVTSDRSLLRATRFAQISTSVVAALEKEAMVVC